MIFKFNNNNRKPPKRTRKEKLDNIAQMYVDRHGIKSTSKIGALVEGIRAGGSVIKRGKKIYSEMKKPAKEKKPVRKSADTISALQKTPFNSLTQSMSAREHAAAAAMHRKAVGSSQNPEQQQRHKDAAIRHTQASKIRGASIAGISSNKFTGYEQAGGVKGIDPQTGIRHYEFSPNAKLKVQGLLQQNGFTVAQKQGSNAIIQNTNTGQQYALQRTPAGMVRLYETADINPQPSMRDINAELSSVASGRRARIGGGPLGFRSSQQAGQQVPQQAQPQPQTQQPITFQPAPPILNQGLQYAPGTQMFQPATAGTRSGISFFQPGAVPPQALQPQQVAQPMPPQFPRQPIYFSHSKA